MRLASRLPRWLLVAGLSVVAIGVGFVVWFALQSDPEPAPPTPDPPRDPRLVFDTPFRNVKPEVKYVGDAACASCHLPINDSYHHHAMGRSADFVKGGAVLEKYDPTAKPSFTLGNFDFSVEKTPEGVRHRIKARNPGTASVPDFVTSSEIAIGSGTRGRSYLTTTDDAVWQTAISWFGPDQRWDVSPGFQLGTTAQRAILPECLFCHVNHVEPIPGTENRYRQPVFPTQLAIGCERCHGPGELHVRERAGNAVLAGLDTSIVNPKHLTPALRIAICEQCHLQGEERVNRRGRNLFEFRPGLPFESFASVYVRHSGIADSHRSVGQFEQMEQSKCFTASAGRLECVSCHDPHRHIEPADRDHHYRQQCLKCHETQGCKEPLPARQAKNDSCITCHMPRASSSNIVHASVTNHRIVRKPTAPPTARDLPFGVSPLVRFRTGPLSPSPAELERDLGIALSRLPKKPLPIPAEYRNGIRLQATERLKAALSLWPDDAEAWGALAATRIGRGEAEEKYQAAKNAVAHAPESEAAIRGLVEAANAVGRHDEAATLAEQLIRLNPTSPDPLLARAFVHLSSGNWAKAEADARAALRLQPLHPEARLYLAICLNRQGDRDGGAREAQAASQLESDPQKQAYLLNWYRTATR